MVNTELLEQTMTAIRDNPELHNQSWFYTPTECGTAMCFAGWACHLAGMEQVQPLSGSSWVKTPDGIKTAHDAAISALGLTTPQGNALFSGGNTVGMLEAMVKDLANTGELLGDWHQYNDVVS
jgi:hypothetical protein